MRSAVRAGVLSVEVEGCGVMMWESLIEELGVPVVPASLFNLLSGSDPAGVRGGEAKAESRGLPWGDCQPDEFGVGSRVESFEPSSRELT